VIRQANNIPASSRLKAGSTILVPKTSASSGDIAESVIETAQVSFEADHRIRTQDKQRGTQRYKQRSRHKR
jgi:membrane-bound lytic murein transglycosylase D